MSYSLNSLKGGCIGDYIGDSYMGLLGGIVEVYTIAHIVHNQKGP